MPTPTPEQAALLATGRWAWLAEILDRWYAEPLRAEDGSTPGEIAAAAERAGCELPAVLVEWFTLVGNRLRMVQDAPVTPAKFYTVDGAVAVWTENQGCWSILVAGDADDPVCVLDTPGHYHFESAPLVETLRGMLLSDTLVGGWVGSRVGPLGPLAPSVRGGLVQGPSDAESAAVATAYEPLPVAWSPNFDGPPRGDAATVVRDGFWLEWMTSDDAAYTRINELVTLVPEGGEHEVVLAFEEPTPAQRGLMTDRHGAPDLAVFTEAVAGLGHLGMATDSPVDVRFHVTTTRPEEVARALLAAVPAELADRAVLAARPVRVGTFQVVHPTDRAEYVLPVF